MDKDRLDLLKETEGYIPPVCPLTGEERKNFYLRLSAVMNVSEEQFLSGKLFQTLLYQKDILPVMYLNENTENTAVFPQGAEKIDEKRLIFSEGGSILSVNGVKW